MLIYLYEKNIKYLHIIVFLCAYMHKTRSETEVFEQFFFTNAALLKQPNFHTAYQKKLHGDIKTGLSLSIPIIICPPRTGKRPKSK